MKWEKWLKIQSKWYDKLYVVYHVHENDTYDLIDEQGDFFRSHMNGDHLKMYHIDT